VVKVQYPGVGEAIRADLENVELLTSLVHLGAKLAPFKVAADPRVVAEEISERVSEELDYRIEAANQIEFADFYAGHPFIRIPAIVPELSTERILVMDEHDGLRWTAALEQPQPLKDTWGEAINRFVYGSLYGFGGFNADPHPGNYLFHEDGGVTFLDFGSVKRFTSEQLDILHRVAQALFVDHSPEALYQCWVDAGFLPPRSKLRPERLYDWWLPIWGPVGEQQPFTFTPEFAASVIERNFDALGEWGDVVRSTGIGERSKDFTMLTRIQLGLYSVLGSLGATADWRAVEDELLRGGPPSTELGRRHAAWLASR
jgi:hypothetical protein